MMISILIGSRNRAHVLECCLKSVFLQDYSSFEVLILEDSDDPKEYEHLIESFSDPRLRLIHSLKPLGVSGSRNKLMEYAKGDILFFIDDDAFLDKNNTLSLVIEIFMSRPEVGILAFKVKNHGYVEREYNVPFSSRALKQEPQLIEQNRYVGYFLGTAHAIRKEVIEECGVYNNELFFGEEELDLSYCVISQGWKIYYDPRILVHHVPQPSVLDNENKKRGELYHHVKNRFYLAFRYLPAFYIPSYLGLWIFRYFVDSVKAKAIREYSAGLIKGVCWCCKIRREPLKPESVKYLKENFGRLWY